MSGLLIDFADPCGGASSRRVYRDPVDLLIARRAVDVPQVLAAVDQATRQHGLHAVGFLSYEAAPAFDRAFRVRPGSTLPLAWFGLFREYTTGYAPVRAHSSQRPANWALDVERAEYDGMIAAIREAIAEGRTYQVNLTARLRTLFDGDAYAWYEELRRAQGPGFHAFFDLDDVRILSISPELFFARRGDQVMTRPMKGTRPRGRWATEDEAHAYELLHSAKDRAENLMIVDLLRNDLGRIAETGSVEVASMFELERYRTVWQLTSTVRARVPRTRPLADIFGALFPCGSVTGAPKISTMQMIAELERSPREVYCGAIGVVEPGGDCTFSVPIRTVWIDGTTNQAEYGVGSGITWDSNAGAEFEEVRAKANILSEPWPPFELIETMRLQHGAYARLERHLARLEESAHYFAFPYDQQAVRALLRDLARVRSTGAWRVRLLIAEAGGPRAECHALDAGADEARTIGIARAPVSSTDRFLFHKTTQRAVYASALADFPDAFDVLLWNEHGELTEFTRGNLVLELDGRRCTPPRSAGLLAGTFRAELIEAGVIEERTLQLADVQRASRLLLINSVREWVHCSLAAAMPR